METKIMSVTPELAAQWLGHNQGNRVIRPARVAAMVADMQAGKWKLTHQGVAFDQDGNLLDGQHRLTAIVKSGVTVDMLVTTGMDREDTLMAMDSGKSRTAIDSLRFLHGNGSVYCTASTALIRFIWLLRDKSKIALTVTQYDQIISQNEELLEFALRMKGKSRQLSNTPVLAGILGAYLNGVDIDTLDRFVELAFRNVIDPDVPPETNTAILNYARTVIRVGAGTEPDRFRCFELTENAIYSYINKLKRVQTREMLPYPIRLLSTTWRIVRD